MRWPKGVAVAAALGAGPAVAGEWQPLGGEALRDALTARTLGERGKAWPLTGAERTWGFLQDGRVLTDLPGRRAPEWRAWQVEGVAMCLSAPVLCGKVERHVRGLDLRITWDDGRVVIMRYVDLR